MNECKLIKLFGTICTYDFFSMKIVQAFMIPCSIQGGIAQVVWGTDCT